jgi:predicted exporter
MPEAFGYQVTVQNGQLVHPDGRHGLLVLETGVPITDSVGSRRLIQLIRNTCSQLPDGFSAIIMSGHLHSVANEDKMRHDIGLISIMASIAFPVLFLIMFRDLRSLLIFLLPAASILVAINLSWLILGRLSYMMVGFGSVLAGVADYGVHIFIGLQYGRERYAPVRLRVRPILLSSLTLAAVFAAFLTSAIEGYRQLAVFALISIALAVGCAILLLPPFLKVGGRQAAAIPEEPRRSRRWPVIGGMIFMLTILAAILPASRVRLDTDITKMDGTGPDILKGEAQFEKLWSGGQEARAIAVVEGATYDEAAQRNDQLHAQASAALPPGDFVGMTSFWPSAAVRAGNLRRWQAFWTEERIHTVRERVQRAAAKQGFSEDAFNPFFELLAARGPVASMPEDSAILTQVQDRLVRKHSGGYWFMSFFPDTVPAREAVGRAARAIPGAFIVSRAGLAAALTDSISAEVVRISIVGLALILALNLTFTGSVRLALAALLPATTGVLWMFGIMGLAGLSINIANMMAGVVVFGCCHEYGIFMAHAYAKGQDLAVPTRHSVTIVAGTALMGAAVLLFAQHPALFSIGLTLVIGLSAGYLAALLGVPGICMLLKVRAGERAGCAK